MRIILVFLTILLLASCKPVVKNDKISNNNEIQSNTGTFLVVLGTVQDGGSPHAGCKKDCCKELFLNPDQTLKVVSLGIVDSENKKKYLIDASPDFTFQIRNLKNHCSFEANEIPDGIFITHAHIGHYTGLMYLGKEAMGTNRIPVYTMPRMTMFLKNNGPWSQLVNLNNIELLDLKNNLQSEINSNIKITPFLVPHRDEFSETTGFIIEGPNKKVLFIPDIDKWEKWETDIIEAISKVDYAFIDGTFYDAEELNNRNMADIPHPFIVESMNLFKDLPKAEKKKIYFIHLNHTNPVLEPNREQTKIVTDKGFNIARMNMVFEL